MNKTKSNLFEHEMETEFYTEPIQKEKQRECNQRTLPSVESNFKTNKKLKKEKKSKSKKEKKLKKRKKKCSRSSSSSSSTDGGEEQWVEKVIEQPECSKFPTSSISQSHKPLERDEWMNLPGLFPCTSRVNSKRTKDEMRKDKQSTFILDKLGQSDRELNPHWKNGGSGLPQTESENKGPIVDVTWLKRSLRRAHEQAEKEGRTIDEVAAERWGSMATIESMISNAESKNRDIHNSGSDRRQSRIKQDSMRQKDNHDNYHYRHDRLNFSKYKSDRYSSQERLKHRSRSRSYERDNSRNEDGRLESKECNILAFSSKEKTGQQNYNTYRNEYNGRRQRSMFKKPTEHDHFSMTESTNSTSTSTKNWQKPEIKERNYKQQKQQMEEDKIKLEVSESTKELKTEKGAGNDEQKVLTEAEMNQLGAKIVKAEIMGDDELATQLKVKLEKAREIHKNTLAKSTEIQKEETVILTNTNAEGMTRPIEPRSRHEDLSGGRRKKKNVETHASGQRIRYFPDDDKYSLQQMYEKAKFSNEDDAVFVKIASKNTDMDDMFEQVCCDESDAKQDARDRTRAIKEHKKIAKSLDNCRFCIDSKQMLKHTIVAMGSEIYLSLPSYISLNTSHCVLAPIHHVTCQTQLDENVWNELQIFKKTLTKMFTDQNESPIFFEIFTGRHKFPHMQLECVALSKEIGDMAPIYFKKALLECETEWSINKKVIDLSQKDVRHAVPKGLSYFAINFGTQGGFAHVIEDENMFPKNFAQEIIGGMLDLDHSLWRKPRKENFDQLRKKVMEFTEIWKKYDFTVNNK